MKNLLTPNAGKGVIISAAVGQEIAGVVSALSNVVPFEAGGRKVYCGSLSGIAVRVVATGPGMANTVQALTALVEKERPSLILQTGCAGVFKSSGLSVGDVAIATSETDIHLGLEAEGGERFPAPLPFPVLSGEIAGEYPVDATLASSIFESVRAPLQQAGAGSAAGPFITVSTITATDETAEALWQRYRPVMEAMEGAGAAHIACHYRIPFIEIRAASNVVAKRDLSRWDLPLSFERIALAIRLLMENADAVPELAKLKA